MTEDKKKKAQLHELLAVVGDLQGVFNRIIDETIGTFANKQAHFMGHVKRYEPFDENAREMESEEDIKKLDTTVGAKLDYMAGHVSKYFDAELQKERTNQDARADLELNGEVIAKDVPATFLLGLESKLARLREVCDFIPTLKPGIEWAPDKGQGAGVFKTVHDSVSHRTKKEPMSKIVVPATKEHPAQVDRWTEDVKVGRYVTTELSGAISPADKSKLIGRIDALRHAVKKARQRANCAEIVKAKIGRKVMDYILKGE